MTRSTQHRHIVTDQSILGGEPIINGTRTPVRAIVELWRLGIRPEEIPTHLPHLTLAQVFDALSYYSDHQSKMDHYIEENRIAEEKPDSSTRGRAKEEVRSMLDSLPEDCSLDDIQYHLYVLEKIRLGLVCADAGGFVTQ